MLATITFEAVAEGSDAVAFAEVELVNDARPDPQLIPTDLTPGQVTIGKARLLYQPLLIGSMATPAASRTALASRIAATNSACGSKGGSQLGSGAMCCTEVSDPSYGSLSLFLLCITGGRS